jgi:hypothetical protein
VAQRAAVLPVTAKHQVRQRIACLVLKTRLIIVAITALFMGGMVATQRHQVSILREREYRDRAAMYAISEISHLLDAATGKSSRGVIGDGIGFRVVHMGPDEHERLAAYFGRLKRKYENAAETPWLPVEPPRGADEPSKIADEQGAMRTRKPPLWARDFGAAAAPSEAAVSSGQ